MEWNEPLPYIVSGVVALLTALLTHRRANRAHNDTVIIDQQKLVNETYEAVLSQLRKELSRRETVHDRDRDAWQRKENTLKKEIRNLHSKVDELEKRISTLSSKEQVVERKVDEHRTDDARHIDGEHGPRFSHGDSDSDLPT